ncbi:MAG: Unknown protein [uncultured Sulfurovum sp.]|uniref:Uncharacterized protein n=1 Tax=uncultured Sulfurovum sp. TaxID=269237 RepID=A0A6S6ST83_9BACT|nr:MAG: Unknown protein [uncultured Sulfurovum sp.]
MNTTSSISPEIYRCVKHCNNCPFLDNGKSMSLNEGRVDNIKLTLLESDYNSFNCHKTVYNLDKDMKPTDNQKEKMCFGAYQFLKEQGKSNIQMRLAYSQNEDEVHTLCISDSISTFDGEGCDGYEFHFKDDTIEDISLSCNGCSGLAFILTETSHKSYSL